MGLMTDPPSPRGGPAWPGPAATRRRTRGVLVALALVALAAGLDGTLLWRTQERNATITAGRVATGPANTPPAEPELRFALAAAQAASGADEAALNAYTALHGSTPLGQAARFNSANALLRQAQKVQAGPQPGQAVPLIELAKETLREILRHDPSHWDARYNLERAQRMLPEPEETDLMPDGPSRSAERAATTMRAYSPGLP
jgi:mxaK protein